VSRALALALLALLLTAAQASLAVTLGVSSLPFVPGVILVAYAALVDPPVEAAISATLVGLVVDALSGTPLGLNVLACLLALLVGRLFVPWVTAPRGLAALAFTGGLSAGYHLVALTLLFVFSAERKAFGFLPMITIAVGNAVAAVVVITLTQRLLVAFKLEQKGETIHERLSSRS
jgi:hypothetical protein